MAKKLKATTEFRKIMDMAYDINNRFGVGVVTGMLEAIRFYREKKLPKR